MMPIPLHSHSHYSLGYGAVSIDALVHRAVELDLPALALTDIESLAGQMRFHNACKRAGIAPVTGVELRRGFSRRWSGEATGRLVLLARDEMGYSSLCRIVSGRRTARRGEESGDPVASLEQGAEGLFLLTDDVRVLQRLLRMEAVEPESLGLLLARPAAAQSERLLVEALAASGVPLVADLDVIGLEREDLALHELLVAIRGGVSVDEVRSGLAPGEVRGEVQPSGERAGVGTGEARGAHATGLLDAPSLARFADLPRSVSETHRIARSCGLDLTVRRKVPPRLPELREGQAAGELRARCEAALDGREYGTAYAERLEWELSTIERLGFGDYFLAVAEIVRGSGKLGVPVAGRGSAAGSLVAFLLGITQVDPVEHDLLFERFLHDFREAPPDIDLDVASSGRAALNEWLVRRFGLGRVAGVASYGTFRARSAARAGLTALGVVRSKVDLIARRLEVGEAHGEVEAAIVERTLLADGFPEVRAAAHLVGRLVGVPSHISVHPGGVVVGDGSLTALVPLERSSSGTVVTQYDQKAVEAAGFLKIDLLGNHFLSERQEALSLLGQRDPGRWQESPLAEVIPGDDDRTWQTLDRADTMGCFQVESPAVRSVLRRLPIREFSDLVAALAIVRPGAAAGAAKERYIHRARERAHAHAKNQPDSRQAAEADSRDPNPQSPDPLDFLWIDASVGQRLATDPRYASLRRRLERTHGVLLFDEDIIRLLSSVGGFGLAKADALRAAIVGAGDDSNELAGLRIEFVRNAKASGVSERVAANAWACAERFASYSFAQAHAASYAVLAYEAAWLRTHAPLEFGCALLNHHQGLYPDRTIAAAVERWGVDLLPPSVNESQLASTVGSPKVAGPTARARATVRVGLSAIKGLTKRTAGGIVARRPYTDLGQFLDSVKPGKRELRSLLLAGACDDLPPLSAAGYPLVHEAVLDGIEGESSPGALNAVLDRVERLQARESDAEEFRAYSALVRARNEVAILGMHVSEHPMRLLRHEATRLACLRASDLESHSGETVRFAGLLAAAQRVTTSAGELRFLTFEDETGLVEAVLPPQATVRLGARLTTPGPYLLEGNMQDRGKELNMLVSNIVPFHERE